MKYLIDIINTDNEPNTINKIIDNLNKRNLMRNLVVNLEKALNQVNKERLKLEKRSSKIEFTCGDNEAKETAELKEINSKLFILGQMSGEIKNNIETFKNLISEYERI